MDVDWKEAGNLTGSCRSAGSQFWSIVLWEKESWGMQTRTSFGDKVNRIPMFEWPGETNSNELEKVSSAQSNKKTAIKLARELDRRT